MICCCSYLWMIGETLREEREKSSVIFRLSFSEATTYLTKNYSFRRCTFIVDIWIRALTKIIKDYKVNKMQQVNEMQLCCASRYCPKWSVVSSSCFLQYTSFSPEHTLPSPLVEIQCAFYLFLFWCALKITPFILLPFLIHPVHRCDKMIHLPAKLKGKLIRSRINEYLYLCLLTFVPDSSHKSSNFDPVTSA